MICQGCGLRQQYLRHGYCSRKCYEGPRDHWYLCWRNLIHLNLLYAWWDFKDALKGKR